MTALRRERLHWQGLMWSLLFSAAASGVSSQADAADTAEGTIIFRNGQDGYPFFRIPSLLRAGRVLLAFAEGRGQRTDHGLVDLVLKRSFDDGLTWSELIVAASDVIEKKGRGQKASIGNPAPLYEPPAGGRSGLVVLFYCRDNKEIFRTDSTDEGLSWSSGTPISWSPPAHWTWVAAGPPASLRLSSGRWIVPCDAFFGAARFYAALKVFSFILYSDDQGVTWHQTEPIEGGNECQAAELPGGTLLLNMRSREAKRLLSLSTDRGSSWSNPRPATWAAAKHSRPSPIADGNCQGSMISAYGGQTLLATWTGPGRAPLTAYVSHSSGHSWSSLAQIELKGTAYSALVLLGNSEGAGDHEVAGVLYEAVRIADDSRAKHRAGGGGSNSIVFKTFAIPSPPSDQLQAEVSAQQSGEAMWKAKLKAAAEAAAAETRRKARQGDLQDEL